MLEYIFRGLLNGSVYALLALPMTLFFTTAATVDFAIGAYALLAAAVATAVPGPLGLLAGLASAVAASGVMALIYVLLKRTSKEGIRVALASFGLSLAISSVVLIVWGTQPFSRQTFTTMFEFGALRVNPQGLINVAISISLVGGTWLVLRHTQLGRMMRAAAVNAPGAELAAIPVIGVQSGTLLAGGLLGGIAGLLILHSSGMDFTASLGLTFIGFAAAIIFGIHSPLRCMAGGLAIGVIEALSAGYTSGMVTSMVPSLFMLLVLLTGQLGAGRYSGDRP
ncbi:MAG: branched-chain amino acid ABC transporter permease [Gammaproteobacteria bacterium]|nr:branched-chain amino acid ABC transporter permease [Gammaproteobacteria bacterium]MBU1440353.1 branched-chain amino acid ABC transporter permease [Gammaproteobacteria bacterium]MBU2288129.1 branched-chain amino acid ABC transporter permease [Gammaproteobacteria bacterium]MBU2407146.1 branched-chain amino acid ABC transporter permease [Gammaproteobacteria bacterium]